MNNTTLDFEEKETKELLARYDFEFFLNQNIDAEGYKQKDIDEIYRGFEDTQKRVDIQKKKNRKQYNYFLEGYVRKMFVGGFIQALLNLNDAKRHVLFDFKAVGENWCYFKNWQDYYKRKITGEKAWEITIKIGSVLGIVLAILKLFELLVTASNNY